MTGSIISSSSRPGVRLIPGSKHSRTPGPRLMSWERGWPGPRSIPTGIYYDSNRKPFRLSTSPATFVPDQYGRYSDLHFLCGPASVLIPGLPPGIISVATQALFFISPTGLSSASDYSALPGLLSACGYFVAFGNDDASKPSFLSTPPRYRWRLMELSSPAEKLSVFSSATGDAWVTTPLSQGQVRAVADNVIALVVWPGSRCRTTLQAPAFPKTIPTTLERTRRGRASRHGSLRRRISCLPTSSLHSSSSMKHPPGESTKGRFPPTKSQPPFRGFS